MSRKSRANFCFVPTDEDCLCLTRPRCGGIKVMSDACPEHGSDAAAPVIMNTHLHPVQGQLVA